MADSDQGIPPASGVIIRGLRGIAKHSLNRAAQDCIDADPERMRAELAELEDLTHLQ